MTTSLTDPVPLAAPAVPAPRGLRLTLLVIAFFQFVLGAAFLLAPGPTAAALGLPAAPDWTGWLFAMMAVRFLGYGVGMLAAARDPQRHRLWIATMIAVQCVDWVATVGHLAAGSVTLSQVSTAAVLPVVFVVALGWTRRSWVGSRR